MKTEQQIIERIEIVRSGEKVVLGWALSNYNRDTIYNKLLDFYEMLCETDDKTRKTDFNLIIKNLDWVLYEE